MASTTPAGSSTSTSTILLSATAIVASAAVAYAIYFDHRRRSDPHFRRSLRKERQKISKIDEESAKAEEAERKERIRSLVADADSESYPSTLEGGEEFFMTEVSRGEQLTASGGDPFEIALCYYHALKVYPQPRELMSLYDKTVPKPVLDILAEMIAIDPVISVSDDKVE